ncbi:hypothetical protein A8135_02645 [Legionella jamestowniensis]|uniref:Uncharacterized protein n=1 Tax=Legionella jamestowniensis TaxID=455 RepID=A0ABX2XV67_9GAMM|nr:hypothetical protein A8135_02645 [Legionella jamestowniensis]
MVLHFLTVTSYAKLTLDMLAVTLQSTMVVPAKTTVSRVHIFIIIFLIIAPENLQLTNLTFSKPVFSSIGLMKSVFRKVISNHYLFKVSTYKIAAINRGYVYFSKFKYSISGFLQKIRRIVQA